MILSIRQAIDHAKRERQAKCHLCHSKEIYWVTSPVNGLSVLPNYCPNCGRRLKHKEGCINENQRSRSHFR